MNKLGLGCRFAASLFGLLLCCVCALPAIAQANSKTQLTAPPAAKDDGIRNDTWGFGLTGHRRSLKAGDGNELLGNAGSVNIGKGYVAQGWWLHGSLDILLGPYETSRGGQIDVDYFGTGLSMLGGYSAQPIDLRHPEGGYGFVLGASYSDLVGRATGRNRQERDTAAENAELIDDYVLRVTDFSIMPGIFFCWLNEGRPRGNSPELLATRLEGYLLTLGVSIPFRVYYQARYSRRGEPGEPVSESGSLTGYSITINLTALLGT